MLTFGRAEQSPTPTNLLLNRFIKRKTAPVLVYIGAVFLFVGVGGGYGQVNGQDALDGAQAR